MCVAPSKQQVAWRCRRGMLELDLLLQQFVNQRYDSLDEVTRKAFVTLLDYPDAVLLDLLMGRSATADPEIARVVENIRAAT